MSIPHKTFPSIIDAINCTPHEVVFYSQDGARIIHQAKPSGFVVRIKTPPQALVEARLIDQDENHGDCWVPLVAPQSFEAGEVTGLPSGDAALMYWGDKQPKRLRPLIVGILGAETVAKAWNGPVWATDTGPDSVVRDADGKILGIRRLQLISAGRQGPEWPTLR